MNLKKSIYRYSLTGFITLALSPFLQGVLHAEAAHAAGGTVNSFEKAIMVLAAMGAVGISCITSSFALARIGSAALGAMSEKPEIGGRAIVFLGMAEGIAIYGLIVAIMILNKL